MVSLFDTVKLILYADTISYNSILTLPVSDIFDKSISVFDEKSIISLLLSYCKNNASLLIE